jgi:hypothetical protein
MVKGEKNAYLVDCPLRRLGSQQTMQETDHLLDLGTRHEEASEGFGCSM